MTEPVQHSTRYRSMYSQGHDQAELGEFGYTTLQIKPNRKLRKVLCNQVLRGDRPAQLSIWIRQ